MDVRDGPVAYPVLVKKMIASYTERAGRDPEAKAMCNLFINRLSKKAGSDRKSVLVFGASWGFSAIAFSESLITQAGMSVFTLSLAHPLTNLGNYLELNPLLTGSLSEKHFSDRSLFKSPVCLGEEGFDGSKHFGFAHNTHFMFACKVRTPTDARESRADMFRGVGLIECKTYAPPRVQGDGL